MPCNDCLLSHLFRVFPFSLFFFLFFSFSIMTNDVTWHHMTAMSSSHSSSMLIHCLLIMLPLSFLRFNLVAACHLFFIVLSCYGYMTLPLMPLIHLSIWTLLFSPFHCSTYGLILHLSLLWRPLSFSLYRPLYFEYWIPSVTSPYFSLFFPLFFPCFSHFP